MPFNIKNQLGEAKRFYRLGRIAKRLSRLGTTPNPINPNITKDANRIGQLAYKAGFAHKKIVTGGSLSGLGVTGTTVGVSKSHKKKNGNRKNKSIKSFQPVRRV